MSGDKKKYKLLLPIFAVFFIFLVLEFGLSYNFYPDHLMKNHPTKVGVDYYKEVIPGHLNNQPIPLNSHLVLGVVLLVLGLFQVNEKFRVKHRYLHRVMGTAYFAIGTVVSGLGLYMSGNAIGGPVTQTAFFVFAGIWYFSAFKSLQHMFRKNFGLHRRWSIRNYFSTLATGFIRPLLGVVYLMFPEQPPQVLFPIACWLSVLSALLISQWYIEKDQPEHKQAKANVQLKNAG